MLLAPTLQSHTEATPGSFSLDEQQWPRPLLLVNLPSRSLTWGHAAGSSYFSVTPISGYSMPLAEAFVLCWYTIFPESVVEDSM